MPLDLKGSTQQKQKVTVECMSITEHSIDDTTYSQIYEAEIAARVKTVAWQACSYPPEKRGSGRRSVASEDEYLHILWSQPVTATGVKSSRG